MSSRAGRTRRSPGGPEKGTGTRAGGSLAPALVAFTGVRHTFRTELREQGSRFVATLVPAADAAGALDVVAGVARELHGATHHCRAWRLLVPGRGDIEESAHDAGEPAGTAGRSILDVLTGAGLVNSVCVVSRWFGGTQLGRGGLARTYAAAAQAAVGGADLGTLMLCRRYEVSAPFAAAGRVAAAARRAGARIERFVPGPDYRALLLIHAERADVFEVALTESTGARAVWTAKEWVLDPD